MIGMRNWTKQCGYTVSMPSEKRQLQYRVCIGKMLRYCNTEFSGIQ